MNEDFYAFSIVCFYSNASGEWTDPLCGTEKEKLGQVLRMHFDLHTSTTRELWTCRKVVFRAHKYSVSKIIEMVGNGYCFLPFTSKIMLDEVQRYLDLGLDVVFMKVHDYNIMRKLYKKYA